MTLKEAVAVEREECAKIVDSFAIGDAMVRRLVGTSNERQTRRIKRRAERILKEVAHRIRERSNSGD